MSKKIVAFIIKNRPMFYIRYVQHMRFARFPSTLCSLISSKEIDSYEKEYIVANVYTGSIATNFWKFGGLRDINLYLTSLHKLSSSSMLCIDRCFGLFTVAVMLCMSATRRLHVGPFIYDPSTIVHKIWQIFMSKLNSCVQVSYCRIL